MIYSPLTFNDFASIRQIGTTPIDCYYNPTVLTALSQVNTTFGIDIIHGWAFHSGLGPRINEIKVNVTSSAAAGDKGRVGIYTSTSLKNIYPDSLVIDSGEIDFSTTGVKTVSISVKLNPNQIYWVAYLGGGTSIGLRTPGTTSPVAVLASPPSTFTGFTYEITKSFTYGSLPSSFPSGATENVAACPAYLHFIS